MPWLHHEYSCFGGARAGLSYTMECPLAASALGACCKVQTSEYRELSLSLSCVQYPLHYWFRALRSQVPTAALTFLARASGCCGAFARTDSSLGWELRVDKRVEASVAPWPRALGFEDV